MKIIFVGLHHKPGMAALDSRTKTGKMVDEIIGYLGNHECEKRNLFPQERMPTKLEANQALRDWKKTPGAIHVLLGKQVQSYVDECACQVRLHHPSYAMRRGGGRDYPALAALIILAKIYELETAAQADVQ